MKTPIKILVWICVVIMLSSCKTTRDIQYIEVPTVKTEYRDHFHRDSVFIKDSVHLEHRGDTVYLSKYNNLDRDIVRRDTFLRIDSISIPIPYPVTKKVNELTPWQLLRLRLFNYLSVIFLALLLYTLRKPIWSIIKRILKI